MDNHPVYSMGWEEPLHCPHCLSARCPGSLWEARYLFERPLPLSEISRPVCERSCSLCERPWPVCEMLQPFRGRPWSSLWGAWPLCEILQPICEKSWPLDERPRTSHGDCQALLLEAATFCENPWPLSEKSIISVRGPASLLEAQPLLEMLSLYMRILSVSV